jgi:hypothetical protein
MAFGGDAGGEGNRSVHLGLSAAHSFLRGPALVWLRSLRIVGCSRAVSLDVRLTERARATKDIDLDRRDREDERPTAR